jgi:hypothetical protein
VLSIFLTARCQGNYARFTKHGTLPAFKTLRIDLVHKEAPKGMKLTNILGQANGSFASILLAISLFGFLFPDHAKQAKQNHRVNLTTTEQVTTQEPADDGSQYEWFY